VADDLEAPWHIIEGLGHVGADPAQSTAAVRTAARGWVDYLLAGQMIRQRTPRRLGVLLAGGVDYLNNSRDGCDPLGVILLKRLDREFELLDGSIDLLRRLAELGALKAGKLEAQLLDLGPRRNRILRHLADDALERINVIGQSGRIDRHTRSVLMRRVLRYGSD